MAEAVMCWRCRHCEIYAQGARCLHPAARPIYGQISGFMRGAIERHLAALPVGVFALTVNGEPGAVAAGRFAWPFRFDPSDVADCNGFCRRADNDD